MQYLIEEEKGVRHVPQQLQNLMSREFALIVVPGVSVEDIPEPQLSGSTTISAFKSLPPELLGSWKNSIGQLKHDAILGSELFLIATANSESSSEDAGYVSPKDKVCQLYWSLFLSNFVTETHSPIIMQGKPTDEGNPRICSFGDMPLCYASGCLVPRRISTEHIQEAYKLASQLTALDSADRFTRIRRALFAFWSGIKANENEERINQFCRAVEGLILPPKMGTAKQFNARGKLFVGDEGGQTLQSIYRVRSDYVHMHSPLKNLTKQPTARPEEDTWTVLEAMTIQIEAVARHCLKAVILSPDLQREFDTDDNIENFWERWGQDGNKASPVRKQCQDLWPAPIGLNEVINEYFDREGALEHHRKRIMNRNQQ